MQREHDPPPTKTHSKPIAVKKVGPTPRCYRALEQTDAQMDNWYIRPKSYTEARVTGTSGTNRNAVEKGKLSYAEWFRVG